MGKILVKCPQCGATVDSGARSERSAFDTMSVMNGTFECDNGHKGAFTKENTVYEDD